jgi:hypothetical protein
MSSAYDGKLLREVDTSRFLESVESAAAALGRVPVYVVLALAIRRLLQFQIQWGNAQGFDRTLACAASLLALTGPFGILIHESGHYLAGAALGQCCRRFVIGPVELARRAGAWTVRWIGIRRAGLVDFVPSTFVRFRRRRAICVAGGPVASLLAGLVFALLSFHAQTSSLFWIWSYSVQWSLVGLLGLLPMRRGDARSDGYLLWELIRGGTAVDELQRNLLVASSHATPLRMRDWPHDLICRLAEVPADPQASRYNAYLAYVHFLDRDERQVAGQYLDRLMLDWKSDDPPEYALEAAYFHAFHGDDPIAARNWLTREGRDAEPWVRLRAQAAMERAVGYPERAHRLVDEALSLLRAAPACGAHQYEVDRLQALLGDAV